MNGADAQIGRAIARVYGSKPLTLARLRDLRVMVAELEQKLARLQTIVAKLPQCWRLNEDGVLVQDWPVVPGMTIWRAAKPTMLGKIVVTLSETSVGLGGIGGMQPVSTLANSFEATEALQKQREADG